MKQKARKSLRKRKVHKSQPDKYRNRTAKTTHRQVEQTNHFANQ